MGGAVHIDHLRPSRTGNDLVATAQVKERLPHEDAFEIRVARAAPEETVALASRRANRRPLD
ncbi:MAG: hypothetical protein IVW52_09295 [Acidimicrobiales bacterium]|nr:hypothetical protein [Acidimicrobiales bacterium]